MIAWLGELALRRPRRVLALAGALFAVSALVGLPVTTILKAGSSDFQDPKAQNVRATAELERATGQAAAYGVTALVQSSHNVLRDPAARRLVNRVAALLGAQRGAQRTLSYPATHLMVLLSRDERQTVILAAFANQSDAVAAATSLRSRLADAGVLFGGLEVVFPEIRNRTISDLRRAELLAFPILLLLSFWVFRGLLAAALPLLVGGFAIVLSFLALRLVDNVAGLSIFAVNLVTGMGLGLAIDYSLFVLARYREELAAGADTPEAIARTLNTSGRTVLYSCLTVAGALASLLVFPMRFLYSMGIGGVLVSLAAGAVSLLVLPALLVVLGPRINALAPARLQRNAARAARPADQGGWFRLARAVMRHPGTVALLSALALLAIASPALGLKLVPDNAQVLPAGSQSRQIADILAGDFAVDGSQAIEMVFHGDPSAKVDAAHLARTAASLAAGQAITEPPRYLGARTWEIELLPHGPGVSAANQRLVRRLRALPSASPVLIGGPAAQFIDQKQAIAAHAPACLAILALVTLGVLFLMTGSAVLPVIAFAMNILTVAVGAGLLVLTFQDGHLSSLLGFSPIGGLEESNLVLLFTITFALSTDYGVFLLARIKEGHDAGLAARAAIALGLERTGRLVTAAALLFCVAIGAFVTSEIFFVKQLGAGAALAVAIDATAVRALLVPALMGWLGERAWWAPAPLRRLHRRIGLSERQAAEPSGA